MPQYGMLGINSNMVNGPDRQRAFRPDSYQQAQRGGPSPQAGRYTSNQNGAVTAHAMSPLVANGQQQSQNLARARGATAKTQESLRNFYEYYQRALGAQRGGPSPQARTVVRSIPEMDGVAAARQESLRNLRPDVGGGFFSVEDDLSVDPTLFANIAGTPDQGREMKGLNDLLAEIQGIQGGMHPQVGDDGPTAEERVADLRAMDQGEANWHSQTRLQAATAQQQLDAINGGLPYRDPNMPSIIEDGGLGAMAYTDNRQANNEFAPSNRGLSRRFLGGGIEMPPRRTATSRTGFNPDWSPATALLDNEQKYVTTGPMTEPVRYDGGGFGGGRGGGAFSVEDNLNSPPGGDWNLQTGGGSTHLSRQAVDDAAHVRQNASAERHRANQAKYGRVRVNKTGQIINDGEDGYETGYDVPRQLQRRLMDQTLDGESSDPLAVSKFAAVRKQDDRQRRADAEEIGEFGMLKKDFTKLARLNRNLNRIKGRGGMSSEDVENKMEAAKKAANLRTTKVVRQSGLEIDDKGQIVQGGSSNFVVPENPAGLPTSVPPEGSAEDAPSVPPEDAAPSTPQSVADKKTESGEFNQKTRQAALVDAEAQADDPGQQSLLEDVGTAGFTRIEDIGNQLIGQGTVVNRLLGEGDTNWQEWLTKQQPTKQHEIATALQRQIRNLYMQNDKPGMFGVKTPAYLKPLLDELADDESSSNGRDAIGWIHRFANAVREPPGLLRLEDQIHPHGW